MADPAAPAPQRTIFRSPNCFFVTLQALSSAASTTTAYRAGRRASPVSRPLHRLFEFGALGSRDILKRDPAEDRSDVPDVVGKFRVVTLKTDGKGVDADSS